MNYIAHSENTFGNTQKLKAHLFGVAQKASSYAFTSYQKKKVRLASLLHDLGKYLDDVQRYLRGEGASVPHARWGAMLAKALGAEDVSFAVDGHHAGLPDFNTWSCEHTAFSHSIADQLQRLFLTFKIDTELTDADIAALCGKGEDTKRQQDICTRFVFSCLTDADWLDTEEHFSVEKSRKREKSVLYIENFIQCVDAELKKLSENITPLNALRTRSRVQALQKAGMPAGFFSLNLPTGLGKTLTSFRWALEHARANALERIIIVLPYTNIIDQTAERLKNILGKDAVLEHHASFQPLPDDKEEEERWRLACENWDYPVIITTSVQFFETLFSNRPAKCRKLHNISKSVVILDEVQTLPKEIVLPTLDMLQDVQHFMGTSFVFCTATMPAFEKTSIFPGIENITELVDDAETLFNKTHRVRYALFEKLRPSSMDNLQDALKKQQYSTLVVVNTKRLAYDLYSSASSWQGWNAVYHLSTRMCPHHRKKIIEEIATSVLHNDRKILVFSTQLVEAGVDFDFPCVFRELAPLESIIQAAGRCNREGRLSQPGVVTIFQVAESGYPDKFYKTQSAAAHSLLSSTPLCLYDYATFKKYYAGIMGLYVESAPITMRREQRDFVTVSTMYRIIKSSTRPVFVHDYNDESRKLYATLRDRERNNLPLSRDVFRAMQQYSIQMYENELFKRAELWEETHSGILVWNGSYDKHTGLCL